MKTILVIDDNDDFRLTTSDVLLDNNYDVWTATCPEEAFPLLKRESFDLILCDLHMPFTFGPNADEFIGTCFEVGVKTVKELAWVFPDKPILAWSAAPALDIKRLAQLVEPIRLVNKPTKCDELIELIERSVRSEPAFHIQ